MRLRGLLHLTAVAGAGLVAAHRGSGQPAAPGPQTAPAAVEIAAQPAPAPTTSPATQPVDASTPKAALHAFAAAMRDGDREKIAHVVLTANSSEERMRDAMADMAGALSALHRSAVKSFGEQSAAQFTDDTDARFAQGLARIETADVVTDGDKATVRYADAHDTPFELRRVAGEWKVPMSDLSKGADPAALEQRLGELNVQRLMVSELAEEIAAGKYKTADAAREAWRGKIMQALPTRPPTTAPVVHPEAAVGRS